jgi:hypothetical protein
MGRLWKGELWCRVVCCYSPKLTLSTVLLHRMKSETQKALARPWVPLVHTYGSQWSGNLMNEPLDELLKRATAITMSPKQREEQRQSFAYGNTHFENERITRATVARASKELAEKPK